MRSIVDNVRTQVYSLEQIWSEGSKIFTDWARLKTQSLLYQRSIRMNSLARDEGNKMKGCFEKGEFFHKWIVNISDNPKYDFFNCY